MRRRNILLVLLAWPKGEGASVAAAVIAQTSANRQPTSVTHTEAAAGVLALPTAMSTRNIFASSYFQSCAFCLILSEPGT